MFDVGDRYREVNALRKADWVDTCVKRLGSLGPIEETLRQAITPAESPGDMYSPSAFRRRVDAGKACFAQAAKGNVSRAWPELFGPLGPHVARAWQDAALRPYLFGSARPPFRGPGDEELLDDARGWFFASACQALHGLQQDAAWLAAWAPHIGLYYHDPAVLGWILAAALRNGGSDASAVRTVLYETVQGGHPVAQMGQHLVVALLNSPARSDWEVVAKLLLAAQRQEGLRQAILESMDEAQPEAFRYMLGVMLDNNLARFSATVRAYDRWTGMRWDASCVKQVNAGIARLIACFDDPTELERTIAKGEPNDAYLALWSVAYQDAFRTVRLAGPLLQSTEAEQRFVGLKILADLRLDTGLEMAAPYIIAGQETDPRLQMCAAEYIAGLNAEKFPEGLFEALAKLFDGLPETKKALPPLVWPWVRYTRDRVTVAAALKEMAPGTPSKLLPYVKYLKSSECTEVVREIAGTGEDWDGRKWCPRQRKRLNEDGIALMLGLIGDVRQDVRDEAFKALEGVPISDRELDILVGLLDRSAGSLRVRVIERLLTLPDAGAQEAGTRLLADRDAKRRAAGRELISTLREQGRLVEEPQAAKPSGRKGKAGSSKAVKQAAPCQGVQLRREDCFGLVPEGSRSPSIVPRYAGVVLETAGAKAALVSLAELFAKHADEEIEVVHSSSTRTVVLGSAGSQIPSPERLMADPVASARARLPLAEMWLAWLGQRPASTRDTDGLELVRAWAWVRRWGDSFKAHLPKQFRSWGSSGLSGLKTVLEWVMVLSGASGGEALLVQHFEDALASDAASPEEQADIPEGYHKNAADLRQDLLKAYMELCPSSVDKAGRVRLARLQMLALERKVEGCLRGPELELFAEAYDAGELTATDLLWLLLFYVDEGEYYGPPYRSRRLEESSSRRGAKVFQGRPELAEAAIRARERVVQIELARGERLSLVSELASQLHHSGGAEVLFAALIVLGKDKITRGSDCGHGRSQSLSRLISVSRPGTADTHQAFAGQAKAAGIKPERLLEVAMFAPQWAAHVEHTLKIRGLEDAAWWIHAHTKAKDYWRDHELREEWAAIINERTELDADDLEEGAVDVAWFRRVIDAVGTAGWKRLEDPSKYACNNGGHKRARLFGDAMLGKTSAKALQAKINPGRNQDAVRALGLVPLPKGSEKAKAETLRRYKLVQEFHRESREFGSQRQASEDKAVAVFMENLARTAGYRDAQRLQWVMEAEAVKDLGQGPVSVTAGDVIVTLSLDADGRPELNAEKKGKPLADVPPRIRSDEQVAELRARVPELRRQQSRMRLSLEECMCRGDSFSGPEFRELFDNALLRPMIERLVFIGSGDLIGYPEQGGRVLRDHAARVEPISRKDQVRLAHPMDLLAHKDWSAWQRECFAAERVQPFKQVFREAYPRTAAEAKNCDLSRRYAGYQIQPGQALALLKRRRWVFSPEEGACRAFHDQGLAAELWFQECFYTAADVEMATLEGVAFRKLRGDRKHLPLHEVPDRLFSEVMRDLDLVVSVAHAGGVDPEASASTIEMRSSLVWEACRLLKLKNVQIKGSHVLVKGELGDYSVHLGSATTSVMPGKVLLIVAVHGQHRGRLFLPFADDDPKTAEVLAKVLLLARDREIQDPSILVQIRD